MVENSRQKVLIIISNLNIGGAEMTMYKTIVLLKNDIDFIVFSLSTDGNLSKRIKEEGIKVYNFELSKNFIRTLKNLYLLIIAEKPDIVHTWMYHSDFFGGIIAKIAKVKCIIWGIRNTDLIKGTNFSTRIIGLINAILSYFIPNKILVVSNSAMIKHKSIGYCSTKMIVIPNGFSHLDSGLSFVEKIKFRKYLKLPETSILIGSVGRFNQYKDHATFIKAGMKLLDMVQPDTEITFLIIGKNVNNPFLKGLINKSNYEEKFKFFEETNDINKFYSIFDIFCLHSISEGFPNVLAEAMLMGCVCISTDVGDAKLILNDDERIIPPKSPDLLAHKLFETINLSKNEKDIIGLQNTRRIISNYSIESMKKKYFNIYTNNYVES